MNPSSNGSVLLTMVLLMGSLIIFCGIVWRTVTLSFEVALKKQEYEQHYQITQAMLKKGMLIAKGYFEEFQRYLQHHSTVPITIKLPSNVAAHTADVQVELQFSTHHAHALAIHSTLYRKQLRLCSLSCILTRAILNEENESEQSPVYYYAVNEWQKSYRSHS